MLIYEILNYVWLGVESLYNLIYWWQGDWVVIGFGVYGCLMLFLGCWVIEVYCVFGVWLEVVEICGNGDSLCDFFSFEDCVFEYLLMFMCLFEGMQIVCYLVYGVILFQLCIVYLIDFGLIICIFDWIIVIEIGCFVLNGILCEFVV